MTSTCFADLNLAPEVLKAITDIGYEQPSPIQAGAIPHLLDGKDILGTAQTGTGKTAAFALPLLSRLDTQDNSVQILVLTPTRELTLQVAEAFQSYARHLRNFHVLPIYGGADYRTQIKGLKRGAQVVVGTPGRVMDHINRGTLNLSTIKSVVLDEADEMLRMGFIDDVTWILERTPKVRQVALFSATMPAPIRKVADTYLQQPEIVSIKSQTQTVERIEQLYWLVRGVSKMDALTRILEVETFDAIILFVRTKTATVEVAEKLEARGYAASALNGDMNQTLRERTIERLKKGQLDIVVATDVAARGIDVARVSHVINYDIPYDSEAYVHRIGRTGRAGRSGKAILFVTSREKRMLRTIERTTSQPILQLELPSHAEVVDKRLSDFRQNILDTIANEDLEFFREELLRFTEEHGADPLDASAALMFMAQRGNPLVPDRKVAERFDEQVRESEREKPGREDYKVDKKVRRSRKERVHFDEQDKSDDVTMESFRIAVGNQHQVRPGDIVGAIANEADLDSRFIGSISIRDDHSIVDLPKGMPDELLNHLKRVYIRNHPIHIQRLGEAAGNDIPRGSKEGKPGKRAPSGAGKKPFAKGKKEQVRKPGSAPKKPRDSGEKRRKKP